jgi:hypothetical protein
MRLVFISQSDKYEDDYVYQNGDKRTILVSMFRLTLNAVSGDYEISFKFFSFDNTTGVPLFPVFEIPIDAVVEVNFNAN